MRPHAFTVNLFLHEDGTLAAHGVDIRGLVLETDTVAEMRDELLRMTPRLLRANHRLSDAEIEQALIHLVTHRVADERDVQPERKARTPCSPRLLWEDHPRLAPLASSQWPGSRGRSTSC